jgi:hypothetical protein
MKQGKAGNTAQEAKKKREIGAIFFVLYGV